MARVQFRSSRLGTINSGAQDLERRTWNEQHLERQKPNLERRICLSALELNTIFQYDMDMDGIQWGEILATMAFRIFTID